MIDPLTSLAFSVQSQPGVYAFLVGSGVSRDAQIPTGWGIVEALLQQLAATRGEAIAGDAAAWYEATFGEPIGFSTLLAHLARSRTERQALLRQFIEPDPDRPEERRPTEAHAAFARLARSGHVRVFITTNFDRLLEQAMEAEGIVPLVVSTAAAAAGAPPFQHERVVIFKVHGDYLDPDSMLVTEDELAEYHPAIATRLATTLEDHGLVTCGWSGDWDPALRAAISATQSRRYPLYFATRSQPSATAKDVISLREGRLVEIESADSFLMSLTSRVAAIDELAEPHPLDTAALVAAVKYALPRPTHHIELDGLLTSTTEALANAIADPAVFTQNLPGNADSTWLRAYLTLADRALQSADPLAQILAVVAAWATTDQTILLTRSLRRVSIGPTWASGRVEEAPMGLRRLPALAIVFAAGTAAVARDNYRSLHALIEAPEVQVDNVGLLPLLTQLHPFHVVTDTRLAVAMIKHRSSDAPLSEDDLQGIISSRPQDLRVTQLLKDWVRPRIAHITAGPDFDAAFERLEVLLAMVAADQEATIDAYTPGPHFGSFASARFGPTPEATIAVEVGEAAWAPLAAGMFGGDPSRASQAIAVVVEGAAKARMNRW